MKRLTAADVEARLAEIRRVAPDDDEQAHILQDSLWRDVLGAIAAGHRGARARATAALEADDIEFSRWYA